MAEIAKELGSWGAIHHSATRQLRDLGQASTPLSAHTWATANVGGGSRPDVVQWVAGPVGGQRASVRESLHSASADRCGGGRCPVFPGLGNVLREMKPRFSV